MTYVLGKKKKTHKKKQGTMTRGGWVKTYFLRPRYPFAGGDQFGAIKRGQLSAGTREAARVGADGQATTPRESANYPATQAAVKTIDQLRAMR